MGHSDSVETHVARRASKLGHIFDRIVACRVMVEAPHRHHQHGKRYHCRIDLTVPRGELVVGKNPPANLQQEDLHAAIDEAFEDAERLLRDFAGRLRERRKGPRAVSGG